MTREKIFSTVMVGLLMLSTAFEIANAQSENIPAIGNTGVIVSEPRKPSCLAVEGQGCLKPEPLCPMVQCPEPLIPEIQNPPVITDSSCFKVLEDEMGEDKDENLEKNLSTEAQKCLEPPDPCPIVKCVEPPPPVDPCLAVLDKFEHQLTTTEENEEASTDWESLPSEVQRCIKPPSDSCSTVLENFRQQSQAIVMEDGETKLLSEVQGCMAKLTPYQKKWWSTAYEQIPGQGCGYHPQRREFACTVKLKQRFGYGGWLPWPGSFEWVRFCVKDPSTGVWQIIQTSAVHVHDEPFGVNPPWYYTVVGQADSWLHQMPVDGRTLQARAILSWSSPNPINGCSLGWSWWWGNVVNFPIKLDP